MSREQPTYGGEGPVRGTGPMAGSYSGVDHHAHRQELWGDVREETDPVPQVFECPRCGKECDGRNGLASHQAWCGGDIESQEVPPEKRRAIYYMYWTTDYSQNDVAEHFGVGQRTVSDISDRNTHLRGQTEEVARELGYPEERDWSPGVTRKVEPGTTRRSA